MKFIKQAIRGCTDLPHVGPHPGLAYLALFVALGFLGGLRNGFFSALVLSLAMLSFVGIIFLLGAIDRANISDRLEEERKKENERIKAIKTAPNE